MDGIHYEMFNAISAGGCDLYKACVTPQIVMLNVHVHCGKTFSFHVGSFYNVECCKGTKLAMYLKIKRLAW